MHTSSRYSKYPQTLQYEYPPDFLTQPRDVSFPFAYEEVENLLGANEYIYILHTQGTFDLNLHSGENQIDPGPSV